MLCELFETMLASTSVPPCNAPPQVRLLERHLDRLTRSARVLGFGFDRAHALDQVAERLLALAPAMPWRLRLSLAHDGRLTLQHAALAPLPDGQAMLLLADARLPDINPLSAHKTTLRQAYDDGVRMAEAAGAFDSLFFSTAGRLVEGGRSSVFVKLDGRWFTPPVADGALPGVMRDCLLDDPAWAATERRLTRRDLWRAQAIVVCNALRGVLQARLLRDASVKVMS